MARNKKIIRKTTETNIAVEINLDGEGIGKISTTIPFLDHMLNLFTKHGFIDLDVKGSGDTGCRLSSPRGRYRYMPRRSSKRSPGR